MKGDVCVPAKYPDEFKRNVILLYEQGVSAQALCEELHIALSTFYEWRTDYRSITSPIRRYTPKDYDDLLRHERKLENEIHVIRLSGFLSAVPLIERLNKLKSIHAGHPEFSIYELCEALEVSRGTFYNFLYRRADPSKREEARDQLSTLIQQIFDDSEQRYGYRKIHTVLAESGIHISPNTVNAIMRELNLQCIRTDAKKEYKKRQQAEKKDYLNRNFTAARPNQIWVSDITSFKVKRYRMYFCAIIDLYSRMIVGFRVSRNASTRLVTSTFRSAFRKRGAPKSLTFHSDRGTQYTSGALCKLLRSCEVRQSFSAPGHPTDNAVSESFFSAFKKEEAYRRAYTSERDFEQSVERYVRFFNEERPHQTLNYLTPCCFEQAYYQKKS